MSQQVDSSGGGGHPVRQSEADAWWLAAILDSSQDAILAWSLRWELTGWNRGAERILGYTREEAVGMSVKALWPSGVSRTLELMVAALCRDEEVARFETDYLRRGGTTVEVSVTISAIRDADRRVTGVTSIVREISQSKTSQRALAEERTRWVAAFHSAPIGMALIDLDGSWLEVNEAVCQLLGRDRGTLLATELTTLTHPDDLAIEGDQAQRVTSGEIDGCEIERRYRLPNGQFVWTALSITLVRGSVDEPRYLVWQFQDITARKEADAELSRYAEQLAELARHDPITGLPNDREFRSQLDLELQRASRYGQEWSLVVFGIDGFQALNDDDRPRADRVVAITGQAVSEACRGSDRPARIGDDRFSLILPNTGADEAQTTATRVAALVQKAGLATLSYGAVTWPEDGDVVESLRGRANTRLREAQSAHLSEAESPADACPTDAIQELVDAAKQFLEMDVAYLARIEDGLQTFRTVSGDRDSFGLAVGGVLDFEATYCRRMLEGRIPNVVPVVADEAELADLEITREADIGAYLGVPVILTNGHTYGTLCAVNHERVPPVADSNVDVMRSFANLIASHVEHDVIEAVARRAGAEVTGMNALLSALTARDHYTGEHSETVVQLASAVARHIGLGSDQVHEVEQVALLHDIGKVGIPDSILQKRGALTSEEWEVMHQHPTIGARILTGVPMFAHLAPAVNAEHERFDGTGYPDGLGGTTIPLASRITFACDAYHAITSDRPYRRALDASAAHTELRRGSGTQFDPEIVDALLHVLDGRAAVSCAA